MAFGVGLSLFSTMAGADKIQEPTVEFAIIESATSAADTAPAVARIDASAVELAGTMATPNPCYDIDAGLAADGRNLTLTLTATSRGGFCPQVVGAFRYTAKIAGLESGDYTLVVHYDYPETGWERETHEIQISAP